MKRIFYILFGFLLIMTTVECSKTEQPKPNIDKYSLKWLGEETELSWVVNGWVYFEKWDTAIQVLKYDFVDVDLNAGDTIVYKVRFLFDTIERMEIYKNNQYQFTTDFIKPYSYKFFTMQDDNLIEIEHY